MKIGSNIEKQIPETYDEVYSSGGAEQIYELPYWRSQYRPVFNAVLKELTSRRVQSILEVGCGNGALAHMILTKTNIAYRGFDFSSVAIKKAGVRTNRPELFFVADARNPSAYVGYYDCIICTEVLEHLENDLEVIGLWKTGLLCICSLPNFDSRTHVRFFQNEEEVKERYGSLLNIKMIIKKKRPELADLSWKIYTRQLVLNLHNPAKLKKILGFNSFDKGGWFVFSGLKR